MGQELEGATPESVGIPSRVILDWIDTLERRAPDPHSLMILRHGRVVAEGWWAPNGPGLKHTLFSLSKSFTSTAVGLAIAEGRFGLDDTVISLFADQAPRHVSPYLAAMKVRHLLGMSTGHTQRVVDAVIGKVRHGRPAKGVREFLAMPVALPPGKRFVYDTPASYMLSALVTRTTGQRLLDYLGPRLFEPLGIEGADWEQDRDGIDMGGFGLRTRTEDIARFGQLYLQKGLWGGRRLIDAEWIEAATAKQIESAPNRHQDWAQGYGYQFWRSRDGGFRADGAFGQLCLVLPRLDLVVAMTAGIDLTHVVLETLWSDVLPACADNPLPEDADAHRALRDRLAGLRLVPRTGAASSTREVALDGAEFTFDPNPLGLASVRFGFDRTGGSIVLRRAGGRRPRPLRFGRGKWRKDSFAFPPDWRSRPVVASAAWPTRNRLELDVSQYTDAFRYAFRFDFSGDRLRLSIRTNVTFEQHDLGKLTATRNDAVGPR